MIYIDVMYAKRVMYRLRNSKIQKDNGNTFQMNFSCNICGDSEKNKSKKRGYVFSADDHLIFKCHNCNASLNFSQWLKETDYNVWKEYKLELFKYNRSLNPPKEPEKFDPKIINPAWAEGLQQADSLNDAHCAKMYLTKRMIPKDKLNLFYYTDKFFAWAATNTDKFTAMNLPDHPRIIMPWFDAEGNFFAYQARTMGNEQPKYYSIVFNRTVPRVYGLERIDWKKPIYVVEGPVDSLFIDNCVAVGTSALYLFDTDAQEVVYIPDNENRNKEILKVYAKLIKLGKKVVIPPDNYTFKDINDAIISGINVKKMISDNVYEGLRAQVKLNEWKRVDYV